MTHSIARPTWHGFGMDLAKKYCNFVVAHLRAQLEEEPRRLEREIEEATSNLAASERQIRINREALQQAEEELKLVAQAIEHPPTDEELQAALSQIEALPYVIGTRVDMQGRLFVQLRISATVEDSVVDVGDFEVGFMQSGRYSDESSYACNYLRIPPRTDVHYGFTSWSLYGFEEGNCATGRITLHNHLLQLGDLVGFVTNVHETLAAAAEQRNSFPLLEEEPEPIWSGFVSNPLKAYRRSLELGQDISLERIRESLEYRQRSLQENIEYYIPRVRSYHTTLRQLRAAYAKATEAAKKTTIEVDPERLKADIEAIAKLPGVMGIKFAKDGTPIIHVRTTHVCDGQRYDFGDFEIHLTTQERNDRRSVVKVRATRISKGNDHLYHHGLGRRGEWFCFGGRASELERMFRQGDFAQFVHLAINSMNAVNDGSDYKSLLDDFYTRIPMDEVWTPKPRRTRLRRQRRSLEEVLSED